MKEIVATLLLIVFGTGMIVTESRQQVFTSGNSNFSIGVTVKEVTTDTIYVEEVIHWADMHVQERISAHFINGIVVSDSIKREITGEKITNDQVIRYLAFLEEQKLPPETQKLLSQIPVGEIPDS